MALYEHVFLARQDVSGQQVEALVEQYKGVIEANGGKVGRIEHWGLKSLTYRIKQEPQGALRADGHRRSGDAVKEMERQMRFNEDILRFMTDPRRSP